MYLMDTRRINKRIMELLQIRQLNITLGCFLAMPISEEIVFEEADNLEKFTEEFKQRMAEANIYYSDDEALIGSMLYSLLQEQHALGKIPSSVIDKIIKRSKVFRTGCFDDNPYLKDVFFDKQEVGRFKLTHSHYEKYELTMYDTVVVTDSGTEIPNIATFDHRFEFPSIMENNVTWMSITPNEIFTMQPHIDKAFGNVLTLGCGMGYFAYMAALKDNVEKVTIVEKSSEVIELFKEYILPQFKVKEKIEIIQADAFDFMDNLADGCFDYCFADIWIGNNDTIPYLKMKKICKRFQKMQMSYWIEEALIETIIGFVFMLIIQEFYKNQNIVASELKNIAPEEQYKIDVLKEILEDVKITKPEHLDYYMNYNTIIQLL